MSEVRVYRITGRITKPNFQTRFQKDVRAVKPEHAVEEVYQVLGSKHRVKRYYIKIQKVEEAPAEESEDG